jgi:hypothetical protein
MDLALAVDRVVAQMTGKYSSGALLRRGLYEYAEGNVRVALQTLRLAAGLALRQTCWRYYATEVGHQRMAVEELIRMLEGRGTEADLAEAEERRTQLQRLKAAEEELRTAALEDARGAMLARLESGDAWLESGNARAEAKGKAKRRGRKKKRKGKTGKPKDVAGGTGKEQKAPLAVETSVGGGKAEEGGGGLGGGAADKGAVEEAGNQEEEQEEEEEEEECCVCLCPLTEDSDRPLGLLACGHRLHDACIDEWNSCCQRKGIRATCPMCRTSLNRL